MGAVAAVEAGESVDETDGGRAGGSNPRTCIVTRAARSRDELIRFVVGPDGRVVPDLKAVLPGRGAWVTADAETLSQAVKRKAFARAFKRDVKAGADLVEIVDRLLVDRAREALALANKAGLVITGFAKVEAVIGPRVVALVHASDASDDGVEKLDRRFRQAVGEGAEIVRVLSGDQLDLATGRSNVVHAALVSGGAARACLDRIRTLVRFRRGMRVPSAGDRVGGTGASSPGTDQE